MDQYDSFAVAIEIQKERESAKQLVDNFQALAVAINARVRNHREGIETASGSDLDYLEGLVDAYQICYNQITEILRGDENA